MATFTNSHLGKIWRGPAKHSTPAETTSMRLYYLTACQLLPMCNHTFLLFLLFLDFDNLFIWDIELEWLVGAVRFRRFLLIDELLVLGDNMARSNQLFKLSVRARILAWVNQQRLTCSICHYLLPLIDKVLFLFIILYATYLYF